MDERTEILILLASASAANCIPCFDHYFEKAIMLKLEADDIRKAVALSAKVKSGAAMFMKKATDETMGEDSSPSESSCCDASTASCC